MASEGIRSCPTDTNLRLAGFQQITFKLGNFTDLRRVDRFLQTGPNRKTVKKILEGSTNK